jgi:hypothetical protein
MTSVIGQSSKGNEGRGEGERARAEASRAAWGEGAPRACRVVSARASLVLLLGLIAQGCPVYEDYCESRADCAAGFRCNVYTGDCELASYGPGPACAAPGDCGPGETCGERGECQPGSCVFHGCVSGYSCGVVDGLHTCTLGSAPGGPGATDAGTTDAGPTDASINEGELDASADASTPADAAPDATP